MRGRSIALIAVGSTSCTLASSIYLSYSLDVPFTAIPELIARSSRVFFAGMIQSWHYKQLPDVDYSKPLPRDYLTLASQCHQRGADSMLKVFQKNKGVYTKVGQHIASLVHIVPVEYTSTLSVLQDKAPFMPWSDVDEVLREELGSDWRSRVFRDVDEVPLAAASLAQVHHATLHDGREVAIKIQYPVVRRQLQVDLATITLALRMVGYWFPRWQFSWVLPEFKTYIAEELNFECEAQNNAKIRALFSHEPQFATPNVVSEYSTKRVLVMEFIHGCRIDNLEEIRRMGFDRSEVARLLLENFSDQVFVGGFLHSDPHPGNVFVRPVVLANGRKAPQIVLLDHGLYRRLKPAFCDNYCNLWRALILRDTPAIEKYARALGAGDFYKVFAFILTFRPVANTNVGLGNKVTQSDWDQIKVEWAETNPEVATLLEKLDRELLLVLRSANILRSINISLGGLVNRYHITAQSAIKGIHFRRAGQSHHFGLLGNILYSWDLFRLEWALLMGRFREWVMRSYHWVRGDPSEELSWAEKMS